MMNVPSYINSEERGNLAGQLFLQGYNCCQSVLLAFADLLESEGLTREQLATIGSGFGGGMARMREVCGSFSALTLIAGFISPAADPQVKAARTANYALVQELAARFREVNGGSIVCRELLGLDKGLQERPEPAERTAEYYRKRPCGKIIANAAKVLAEYLNSQSNNHI